MKRLWALPETSGRLMRALGCGVGAILLMAATPEGNDGAVVSFSVVPISGQALVPQTTGMTVAWVARALSGTRFSVVDSTTDPDRNGTFAEPLPAGTYTSATGRNPYTADVTAERNGATGPGFFQLDLRLGYRVRPGSGRSLDLFADIFNVTNRANFDNPIGDRRSTDFLNLTTLRSGGVPSTLQLGARFEF